MEKRVPVGDEPGTSHDVGKEVVPAGPRDSHRVPAGEAATVINTNVLVHTAYSGN